MAKQPTFPGESLPAPPKSEKSEIPALTESLMQHLDTLNTKKEELVEIEKNLMKGKELLKDVMTQIEDAEKKKKAQIGSVEEAQTQVKAIRDAIHMKITQLI